MEENVWEEKRNAEIRLRKLSLNGLAYHKGK